MSGAEKGVVAGGFTPSAERRVRSAAPVMSVTGGGGMIVGASRSLPKTEANDGSRMKCLTEAVKLTRERDVMSLSNSRVEGCLVAVCVLPDLPASVDAGVEDVPSNAAGNE